MTRFASGLTLLCVFLALGSAVNAQEKGDFLFGLESRFGEPPPTSQADHDWGIVPNFSYRLSERLRLDAFAGFAWSEADDFTLSLIPGLRYYLITGPGRFHLNTGLSVGFDVIDQNDRDTRFIFGPGEFAGAVPPDLLPDPRDERLFVRVVPLEVEYWGRPRTAFTLSVDHESTLFEGGDFEDEGFGISMGFRYRIK